MRKKDLIPDVMPYRPGEILTSARLMELTGCTRKSIRSLCRSGRIKSIGKNKEQRSLYDYEALYTITECLKEHVKFIGPVNRVPMPEPYPSFSTEDAVRVFHLIKKKMSLEEIVLETNVHPKAVRGIVREYENLSGSIIVYKETLDKMNSLSLDGIFPLAEDQDIYEVMKLASLARKCRRCYKRNKSELCSYCERQKILKNISVRKTTDEEDTNDANEDINENDKTIPCEHFESSMAQDNPHESLSTHSLPFDAQ